MVSFRSRFVRNLWGRFLLPTIGRVSRFDVCVGLGDLNVHSRDISVRFMTSRRQDSTNEGVCVAGRKTVHHH